MNTVNITSGFIAVTHGFITAISAPTAVIPATSTVISAPTAVIPATSTVIPAKAGIHHASGSQPSGDRHKPRHLQLAFVPALQGFANAMDSRLRGNDDGVVRHFSMYQPPRELCAIDADLDAVSGRIMKLLAEVHS